MWSDTPDGSFYHSFWGQRYSNGIPQWPVEGKLLVAANNNYIYSKALHGDYLVFQQEDYQTFSMSVRALKIGSNGDPAPGWPQGGLAVIPGTTYFAMYLHSGIVNDDLLVFMSYSDQSDVRSSVQKLNSDGQALWGNTGVIIGNNANAYDYWIDDAVYGDNITWIKRVMGVYELRVMSMDQNGNLVWAKKVSIWINWLRSIVSSSWQDLPMALMQCFTPITSMISTQVFIVRTFLRVALCSIQPLSPSWQTGFT
jgi:hypothetical protein